MPALGIAVILREGPADALRPISGNANHKIATRLQNPYDFFNGNLMLRKVFQNLGANNNIEIIILKGQAGHVRRRKPPYPAAVFSQPKRTFADQVSI